MINKILEKITKRHEYALDVRSINTDKFLYQIDCFHSFEKAKNFADSHPCKNNDECYSIVCIQYDAEDNEIGTYEMYNSAESV